MSSELHSLISLLNDHRNIIVTFDGIPYKKKKENSFQSLTPITFVEIFFFNLVFTLFTNNLSLFLDFCKTVLGTFSGNIILDALYIKILVWKFMRSLNFNNLSFLKISLVFGHVRLITSMILCRLM